MNAAAKALNTVLIALEQLPALLIAGALLAVAGAVFLTRREVGHGRKTGYGHDGRDRDGAQERHHGLDRRRRR